MRKGFRVLTREEAAEVFAKGGDSGGSSSSNSSSSSSSTSGGKSGGGGDSSSSSGGAGSTSFTYTPSSGGSGTWVASSTSTSGGSGIAVPSPTIPPVTTTKPDHITYTPTITVGPVNIPGIDPIGPYDIPRGVEIHSGPVTVAAKINDSWPPTATISAKINID